MGKDALVVDGGGGLLSIGRLPAHTPQASQYQRAAAL